MAKHTQLKQMGEASTRHQGTSLEPGRLATNENIVENLPSAAIRARGRHHAEVNAGGVPAMW